MYSGNALGVVERVINVRNYYYYYYQSSKQSHAEDHTEQTDATSEEDHR